MCPLARRRFRFVRFAAIACGVAVPGLAHAQAAQPTPPPNAGRAGSRAGSTCRGSTCRSRSRSRSSTCTCRRSCRSSTCRCCSCCSSPPATTGRHRGRCGFPFTHAPA